MTRRTHAIGNRAFTVLTAMAITGSTGAGSVDVAESMTAP